jgi:hypothetical protein
MGDSYLMLLGGMRGNYVGPSEYRSKESIPMISYSALSLVFSPSEKEEKLGGTASDVGKKGYEPVEG